MLLSCGQKHSTKDNLGASAINKIEVDSTSYNTKQLIGEWDVMVTISEGIQAKCNACPKIKFFTDYTAIIIYPNGQSENIKWEIKNKTVIFKYLNEDAIDRAIDEAGYEMSFTQKEKSVELLLNQKDKNHSYILIR
jgi:hypothetical protein